MKKLIIFIFLISIFSTVGAQEFIGTGVTLYGGDGIILKDTALIQGVKNPVSATDAVNYRTLLANSDKAPILTSIADLKVATDTLSNKQTLGYYTEGDNGHGEYYWVTNSGDRSNGGTVIQSSIISTDGKWVLLPQSEYRPEQFGFSHSNIDSITVNARILDSLMPLYTNNIKLVVYEYWTDTLDWTGWEGTVNGSIGTAGRANSKKSVLRYKGSDRDVTFVSLGGIDCSASNLTTTKGVLLQNLEIYGYSGGDIVSTGIKIAGLNNSVLENVNISFFDVGIRSDYTWSNRYTNIIMNNIQDTTLIIGKDILEAGQNGNVWDGLHISGSDSLIGSVYTKQFNDITFRNCVVDVARQWDFSVNPIYTGSLNINGGHWEDTAGSFIQIDNNSTDSIVEHPRGDILIQGIKYGTVNLFRLRDNAGYDSSRLITYTSETDSNSIHQITIEGRFNIGSPPRFVAHNLYDASNVLKLNVSNFRDSKYVDSANYAVIVNKGNRVKDDYKEHGWWKDWTNSNLLNSISTIDTTHWGQSSNSGYTKSSMSTSSSASANAIALITDFASKDEILIEKGTYYFNSGTLTDVTLRFEEGAILDVIGTLILDNVNIIAGITQIFTNTSTIEGTPLVQKTYPEWFGVIGDGATNDFEALDVAFDFARITSSRKVVLQGDKTYFMNPDAYLILDVSDLTIEGNNANIVFDRENWTGSSSYETRILYTSATTPTSIGALTVNGVKGTNFVEVASFGTLAMGDMVKVVSTADGGRGSTVGELMEVSYLDAVNDRVFFTEYLNYTYLVSETATLHKIPNYSLTIKDLKITGYLNDADTGNNNIIGIQAFNVKDGLIDNVHISNTQYTAFNVSQCYNLNISNSSSNKTTEEGAGYGVTIAGSKNTDVQGFFKSAKHAIVTTQSDDVLSWNTNVHDSELTGMGENVVSKSFMNILYTHGEYTTMRVENVIIDGGITDWDLTNYHGDWHTDSTYTTSQMVNYDDVVYYSTSSSNTGNTPPTDWDVYSGYTIGIAGGNSKITLAGNIIIRNCTYGVQLTGTDTNPTTFDADKIVIENCKRGVYVNKVGTSKIKINTIDIRNPVPVLISNREDAALSLYSAPELLDIKNIYSKNTNAVAVASGYSTSAVNLKFDNVVCEYDSHSLLYTAAIRMRDDGIANLTVGYLKSIGTTNIILADNSSAVASYYIDKIESTGVTSAAFNMAHPITDFYISSGSIQGSASQCMYFTGAMTNIALNNLYVSTYSSVINATSSLASLTTKDVTYTGSGIYKSGSQEASNYVNINGTDGGLSVTGDFTSQSITDDGIDVTISTDLDVAETITADSIVTDAIYYADSYWDDLQVDVSSVQLHPSNTPTWTAFRSGYALSFDNGDDDEIYFTAQVPHKYKHGTNLDFHVHCAYPDANAGNVEWVFTYSWANIGSAMPTATSATEVVASPTAADTHTMHDIEAMTGTGMEGSSMIICSLTRLSSTGASDTYNNDVYLLAIDFHFEIDKPGSPHETP